MKNILKYLIPLVISAKAFAGLPPTSLKGQSQSTATTTFSFQAPLNQATQISGPTSLIETGNTNILSNPGFEGGTTAWTASGGTFTTTTTTANIGTGKKAGDWDSSAAAQTLSATSVTIPAGLFATNGYARCNIQVPSGTATHTLDVTDGTNVLVSTAVTSSTTYANTSVNFIFPSSGSIVLRLKSVASNEPEIFVDDCYIGTALNISQISQALFVGSAYFATTASCTFTRTNTALGALSDTDCPGPTVEFNPGPGTIQTTDADAPKVTVNNLPPGNYEVNFVGGSTIATSTQLAALAINDGTTTSGQTTANNITTGTSPFHVTGYFTYTAEGNRTFELFASSAANAFNIDLTASNQRLYFYIKRFPSSNHTALNIDQTPSLWSGYHDNTCSWARTNTSYGDPTADTTCTLTERQNVNFGTVTSYLSGSDKLPGIVFTPQKAGQYYVCAQAKVTGGTLASTMDFKLWDGTTTIAESEESAIATGDFEMIPICGLYNAASTSSVTLSIQTKATSGSVTINANSTNQSTIEWSLVQVSPNAANPQIINGVASSANGGVRIATAYLTNTGSCAVSTQDGNWISSASDVGVGRCLLGFTAGIFSATPNCFTTVRNANGSSRICIVNNSTTTPSATQTEIQCLDSPDGSASDSGFNIMCVGAK